MRPGPQAMIPSAIVAHVRWTGQPSGSELDDRSHEEQSERRKACAEAKDQQDRKKNLSASGKESRHGRRWKMVLATRPMEHELVGKQRDGSVAEVQEAIPFEDAGAPERHRQRNAHHQLNERR